MAIKKTVLEKIQSQLVGTDSLDEKQLFSVCKVLWHMHSGMLREHKIYSDCCVITAEYKRKCGFTSSGDFNRYLVENDYLEKVGKHNQNKAIGQAYRMTYKATTLVEQAIEANEPASLVEFSGKTIRPIRKNPRAIRSKDVNGHTRATENNISANVKIDLAAGRSYVKANPSLQHSRTFDALAQASNVNQTEPGTIIQHYRESASGRLYGQSIHLQNSPRGIRAALLNGQNDYDIEACHPFLLNELAKRFGGDYPMIDYFLANKKAFRQYLSDECGSPIDHVKESINALVCSPRFGANLRTTSIEEVEYGCYAPIFENVQVKQLAKEFEQAGNTVLKQQTISRGGILNALGKHRTVTNKKAKMLSHILTGIEVQALDIAMGLYGDNITLLAHDGFVTKEPINTNELINKVESKIGFTLRFSHDTLMAA